MTDIVTLLESVFFPRVVPSYFGPLLPVIKFVGVLIGDAIILLIFTAGSISWSLQPEAARVSFRHLKPSRTG